MTRRSFLLRVIGGPTALCTGGKSFRLTEVIRLVWVTSTDFAYKRGFEWIWR